MHSLRRRGRSCSLRALRLGGLVAGTWGIYPSFVIDALSFVLSALVLSRIQLEVQPRLEGDRTLRTVMRQYVQGLRYLKGHGEVAVTALHKAALVFCFGAPLEVVQVAISREVFSRGEGGALGLGMMYAVVGMGAGLGPIAARYITGDRLGALRWSIALGYGFAVIGLLLVATLVSFEGVLLGIFIRSFGSGIIWVFSTQILLQIVLPEVRGRIFSTEIAFSMLMSAVGASIGGILLGVVWHRRGRAHDGALNSIALCAVGGLSRFIAALPARLRAG